MHQRSFRWCVTIILIGLFKLSLLKKVILSLIYECVPIDKKHLCRIGWSLLFQECASTEKNWTLQVHVESQWVVPIIYDIGLITGSLKHECSVIYMTQWLYMWTHSYGKIRVIYRLFYILSIGIINVSRKENKRSVRQCFWKHKVWLFKKSNWKSEKVINCRKVYCLYK